MNPLDTLSALFSPAEATWAKKGAQSGSSTEPPLPPRARSVELIYGAVELELVIRYFLYLA
jgi:hypothetical protein